MITLRDIGYRTPDRFVLGYWPESVGRWDYTVVSTRSFVDNNQDGIISGYSPDSDSSAIVWWGYPGQAITLNAGESVDLAILYGISNMSFYTWSPFDIGLTSPGELEISTDVATFQYLPYPFIITAYLQNVTNAQVNNATITLNLPPELFLDSGEQPTKFIEETSGSRSVSAKKSAQVSWRVATCGRYIGDRLFSATVNASGGSKTATRSIFVPGLGSAIFGQVTDNSGSAVSGATLKAVNSGSVIATTSSQPDGTYIFRDLAYGSYEVITSAAGYTDVTTPATVSGEAPSTNPVLLLAPSTTFESFAYPNPAREGDVKIRWFYGSTENIAVKIFNSAGSIIKKYDSNTVGNNWKEISWNIDSVANGIYFYKIEGDGIAKTGKIAVLKKGAMK